MTGAGRVPLERVRRNIERPERGVHLFYKALMRSRTRNAKLN